EGKPAPFVVSSMLASSGTSASSPIEPSFLNESLAGLAAAAAGFSAVVPAAPVPPSSFFLPQAAVTTIRVTNNTVASCVRMRRSIIKPRAARNHAKRRSILAARTQSRGAVQTHSLLADDELEVEEVDGEV